VTLAAATAIEVSLLEALTKNDLAHFGMPAAAAQVPTHWIQFLGQTNTASPSPPARGAAGLELRAADGLLVATDSQGNNLWMRADGEAEIRLDRGHLDGNRGFLLHHSTGGRLALRMPAVPVADPAHRYRATFGATRLAGAGSFLFEQPPDGRIHVQLRDPDSGQPTPGTVVVDFASERAAERTLSGVHALDVWLEAGELKRLEAAGRPLSVVDREQGLELAGSQLLLHPDGSLYLTGGPATVVRSGVSGPSAQGFRLDALRIFAVLGARQDVALDASGNVELWLDAFELEPGTPAECRLRCDRLLALPGLIDDRALVFPALAGGNPLQAFFAADLGSASPWLVADANVQVELSGKDGSHRSMAGSRLLARVDGQRLLLLGPNARFEYRPGGSAPAFKRLTGVSNQIARTAEHIVFGLPDDGVGAVLVLEGGGDPLDPRAAGGSDQQTHFFCSQPIHLTKAAISMAGPTRVLTTDLSGVPLPDGLSLTSAGFYAARDQSVADGSGRILSITANGPVEFSRAGLTARGDDRLFYDTSSGWLELGSKQRTAEIAFDNGLELASQWLSFNVFTNESRIEGGTLRSQFDK
jgi:hypothetical protein